MSAYPSDRSLFGLSFRGVLASAIVLVTLAFPLDLPAQQSATRPTTTPAGDKAQWSNIADGLQARFLAQSGPLKAGDLATVSVEIQNAADSPVEYECSGVMVQGPEIVTPNSPPLDAVNPEFGGVILSENKAGKGATQTYKGNDLMHGLFARYTIQPGGSVFISQQIPSVIPMPGEYHVVGSVRTRPLNNHNVPDDMTNTLFLPALTLKVDVGDPAAAFAYDIHWGQPTNGLRIGLQFQGGFRAVAQYGIAAWTCIAENVTDQPISFTYDLEAEREETPVVKDSAGIEIPVTVHRVELDYLEIYSRTLPPHQVTPLCSPYFWIMPPGGENITDEYTPIIHAIPGEYQVGFTMSYKPQGSVQWSGKLTSGSAPLKVVKADIQRPFRKNLREQDNTTPWGTSVEGVSLRAWTGPGSYTYPQKSGPGDRAIPLVFLDMRNLGTRSFSCPQTESLFSLRINDVTYKWTGNVETKSSPLPPQRTDAYIHLDLDDQAWKDENGKSVPPLVPGSYKVQVATTCKAADGGKDIQIESEIATVQVSTPQ